jgi:CRISPR system Cascade subunit CasC
MTRYLDIHVLQTVPPSNLNRDESGTPKSAVYGGVRRARVSSQSWKRATRRYFASALPASALATRTLELTDELTERLTALSVPAPLATEAASATAAALRPKKSRGKAKNTDGDDGEDADGDSGDAALFIANRHIDEIVDKLAAALTAPGTPKVRTIVTELNPVGIVGGPQPIEISLFGRMVANVPDLRVDAACQVAHALSTHNVDVEFDYYTAVDDRKERRRASGAAMIGSVEFNAALLYRYATINIPRLEKNLGDGRDRAAAAARLFAEAFIRALPSGKQNTFAGHTLPEVAILTVRDDQPLNLVAAFEEAVTSDAGYLRGSLTRLAHHAENLYRLYDTRPRHTAALYPPDLEDLPRVTSAFGTPTPLPGALDTIEDLLAQAPAALVPQPVAGDLAVTEPAR